MPHVFSLRSPMPWALALGGCLLASCDEKGVTSICPTLPLYQTYPLGDASPADAAGAGSSETRAALAAAIDAGCVTAPSDFPIGASAAGAAGDESAGGNAGDDAGAAGAS
jgi:hypothetical protein